MVLAVGFLGLGVRLPLLFADSTTVAPEVDLYLTHNNIFRSRVIAGANWSDINSKWTSGLFEYTVDFGLKTFFRRYVYKDPNVEKSKIITVRLGYGYLPDFQSASSDMDEHRGVADELSLLRQLGVVPAMEMP